MNKKEVIVSLLRKEVERALNALRNASAAKVGTIAASKEWDYFNDQDGIGSFSSNPYNIDSVNKRELESRQYYEQIKEAYEFAVDTFITQSP